VSRQDTSRDRRSRETREALLATAYGAFCAHGYARASLDAIARGAGFTKGALYTHFASKDDLFVAVARRQLAELAGELEELDGTGDPGARLGEWLVEAMAGRRAWFLANAEFAVAAARTPGLARQGTDEYQAFSSRLGAAAGVPGSGEVLLALVNGLIIHAAVRPEFDLAAALAAGVALVRGES
jgi:AcrR family transcriptional regulator